jgi:hypothetical protein
MTDDRFRPKIGGLYRLKREVSVTVRGSLDVHRSPKGSVWIMLADDRDRYLSASGVEVHTYRALDSRLGSISATALVSWMADTLEEVKF